MCSQLCSECLYPSPLQTLLLKPNHQLGPEHRPLLKISSALKGSRRELPCHLTPTEGSTRGCHNRRGTLPDTQSAGAWTLNFQPSDCKTKISLDYKPSGLWFCFKTVSEQKGHGVLGRKEEKTKQKSHAQGQEDGYVGKGQSRLQRKNVSRTPNPTKPKQTISNIRLH